VTRRPPGGGGSGVRGCGSRGGVGQETLRADDAVPGAIGHATVGTVGRAAV